MKSFLETDLALDWLITNLHKRLLSARAGSRYIKEVVTVRSSVFLNNAYSSPFYIIYILDGFACASIDMYFFRVSF